jgi:hypothetical protein
MPDTQRLRQRFDVLCPHTDSAHGRRPTSYPVACTVGCTRRSFTLYRNTYPTTHSFAAAPRILFLARKKARTSAPPAPALAARVRPHCRLRNRDIAYLSETGIKWMDGCTKRQCDRAILALWRLPAGRAAKFPFGEQCVRLAQKMRVGPCIPAGIQLQNAEVGSTSGPTWRLSHCRSEVLMCLSLVEYMGAIWWYQRPAFSLSSKCHPRPAASLVAVGRKVMHALPCIFPH